MGIIVLIFIGVLVYFVFQAQKKKDQTPTQKESPLDILKRRYANAEIAKEEYERMKKDPIRIGFGGLQVSFLHAGRAS